MTGAARAMTRAQARRVAIAAQGFLDPRPAPFTATMRHVQRVVDRVGVIQIDSVNVLARSQYLPLFARLGPYDTALLDRARDQAPRRLVEYWAHEASLVPPSTWPLLDFRMRAAAEKAWGGMRRILQERPDFVDVVQAEVEARGPMTAREVEVALEHDQPRTSGAGTGPRSSRLWSTSSGPGGSARPGARPSSSAVTPPSPPRPLPVCARHGPSGRVPRPTRTDMSSSSASPRELTASARSCAWPTTSG